MAIIKFLKSRIDTYKTILNTKSFAFLLIFVIIGILLLFNRKYWQFEIFNNRIYTSHLIASITFTYFLSLLYFWSVNGKKIKSEKIGLIFILVLAGIALLAFYKDYSLILIIVLILLLGLVFTSVKESSFKYWIFGTFSYLLIIIFWEIIIFKNTSPQWLPDLLGLVFGAKIFSHFYEFELKNLV